MIKYLILDDELQAREILRYQMDRIKDTVCVAEAANVHEALEKIADTDIDLLFLDIEIHGNQDNGYEIAKRLTDNALNYGIIYVTAKLDYYYGEVIQSAGKYLYFNVLNKNLLFSDLEKVIAEFRKVRLDYEAEKQKSIQDFLENLDKEVFKGTFRHSHNGITYIIPYEEILCVFVYNRLLTIISVSENIEIGNLQLVKFVENLAQNPYSFLKIGRNYLINPKAIRKVDANKGIVSLFLGGKAYQIGLESGEIAHIRKEVL